MAETEKVGVEIPVLGCRGALDFNIKWQHPILLYVRYSAV